MRFLSNHIVFILLLFFLSACVANQRVQSNLPSPGKQCKVLVTKNHKKNSSKKKEKRVGLEDQPKVDHSKLQAQLMTNEEYLEQVAKVKKSLPQFDVEKDCPPSLKKPSRKKHFNIWSIFKRK